MVSIEPFLAGARHFKTYQSCDKLHSAPELGGDSQRNRQTQIVIVVDEDGSTRQTLTELFVSSNLDCIAFKSAAQYLQYSKPDIPSCLVVGLPLQGIEGTVDASLITSDPHPPIIFIADCCDIRLCVRAIKAGAVDYLIKPFSSHAVLKAVNLALERDIVERRYRAEAAILEARYATLTSRERDVLILVVAGLLNKQAAGELGIKQNTLQIHRGKVMRKMNANSLADLVRMAIVLGIPLPPVVSPICEPESDRKLNVRYARTSTLLTLVSALSGNDQMNSQPAKALIQSR
jgi:FixJ family two-component response regulator